MMKRNRRGLVDGADDQRRPPCPGHGTQHWSPAASPCGRRRGDGLCTLYETDSVAGGRCWASGRSKCRIPCHSPDLSSRTLAGRAVLSRSDIHIQPKAARTAGQRLQSPWPSGAKIKCPISPDSHRPARGRPQSEPSPPLYRPQIFLTGYGASAAGMACIGCTKAPPFREDPSRPSSTRLLARNFPFPFPPKHAQRAQAADLRHHRGLAGGRAAWGVHVRSDRE